MFWDKFRGSKSPKTYYKNEGLNSDDWLNNYPYGNFKRPGGKKRGKTLYRLTLVAVIIVLLVAVKQAHHPVAQEVRDGLRYVLTAEWNFQPVIAKVVQLGTQMVGMEHNFNNDVPPGNYTPVATKPGSVISNERLMPVSGKIVRGFGWSLDPLDGMERFHSGVDISAATGTPVLAVRSGRVMRVAEDDTLGDYILLEHGEGSYTLYAGLSNIQVTEGQRIEARQRLAEVGDEGDVPGGGLHFEVREKGKLIDPLTVLDAPKE